MLKKIAISIVSLIFLLSLIVAGYEIYQPDSSSSTSDYISSFYIDYKSLESYIQASGNNTSHYFLFCIPEDNNCKYVYESIIKQIKVKDTRLDTLIEYVDVSSLLDTGLDGLKQWEISTYPALVSVSYVDSSIQVNNSLEYDINDPINKNEVIQWLNLNNIEAN